MADACRQCEQLREDLARAQARIAELEAAAGPSIPDGAGPAGPDPAGSPLQQERDRMAAILAGINDVCVGLDRQFRVTYVNHRAEQFYGKTAAELLGRIAWDVYPILIGTEFQQRCLRAMQQRVPTQFEIHSKVRPGCWLEFRIGPTYEGLGIVVTDITARKQAEQQLKELNETLEQRVAERTAEAEQRAAQLRRLAAELTRTEQRERQRLAQILHDHLQQLLVAAKLNLGSLRSRTRSDSLREGLGRVSDMLVAALEASRSLTVELSPPVLRKGSLRDVLHWLAGWIKSRHGLTVNVQADSAPEPESREMRALLFQAVRELLFNVVKHAGTPEATVLLEHCDGRLRISVIDQGVGFEASGPDSQKGTGFGLFSIRERFEMLGGRLEIDSRPGRGTRITLVTPMALADEKGEQSAGSQAAPRAEQLDPALGIAPRAGKRIRVLLADDHQLVQDGLRQLLTAKGDIEVVGQACDGRQAVEMAARLRPDVVLMDVDMPGMDGVEATRRICAQQSDARVIGLSMLNEPSVAHSMLAAGALRYLTKTSSPEVLLEAVRLAASD